MLKNGFSPADGIGVLQGVQGEPVSHIVIHDSADSVTQYRQFDDLGNAVAYVEELRNAAGVDARLYTLDEVKFEVKQYFRVEVVDGEHEHSAVSPQVPDTLPTVEDVALVEASMRQTIDASETDAMATFAPLGAGVEFGEPIEEAIPAGGDPRRGLFGR